MTGGQPTHEQVLPSGRHSADTDPVTDEVRLPHVAHCHLGLGKLSRRTGKQQAAEEPLTTATTVYRDMDMTYWREQALAELRERS